MKTVHMENLSFPATLENIQVLIMSYSNMKPHSPEVHEQLKDWVKQGGVLVYVGKDDDPYQTVMEWWNSDGNDFKAPSEHLFKGLGIKRSPEKQIFEVGAGKVYVIRKNPKEFVMNAGGDTEFIETISSGYLNEASANQLSFKNHFYLERGPYDIVAVMDESVNDTPFVIEGPVIDLFDPELPILEKKSVPSNEQAFLLNLNRVKDKNRPQVLASASRIYDERAMVNSYSFLCKSPANTQNSMRILLPKQPKEIQVLNGTGESLADVEKKWDASSKTYYLGFENNPDGITVKMVW